MTFLRKNESNIWTLSEHDSKNWFFSYYSNNWALFKKIGSQNWFFKVILNIDFFFEKKNTDRIERIEPFLVITRRIEFLLKIRLKELNFFFSQLDSKNCSFLFFHDSNTWTFFTWLKELNFLFYVTQILELFWLYFSKKWTLFFFRTRSFFIKKKNSQNWIFCESDPQNWFFFCELNRLISWIWRKELNRLISWIWRKDLNPFSKYHSKNWFFFDMTQRIELSYEHDSKIFWGKNLWLKESKLFFYDSRIEPFFNKRLKVLIFSKIWLTELQLLFTKLWLKELTFWKYDSQIWTFLLDSKNWTFFWLNSKDWTFFWFNSKNWTLFILSKI